MLYTYCEATDYLALLNAHILWTCSYVFTIFSRLARLLAEQALASVVRSANRLYNVCLPGNVEGIRAVYALIRSFLGRWANRCAETL